MAKTKKKRPYRKSAAVLTVNDCDTMTHWGRKRIAKWMRNQAGFIEKHGKQFSHRFTARFMYTAV